MSIKFTETGIDKTTKIHQKVICSKFMFKIFTIHMNICSQTITECPLDSVPDQQQRRCCRRDMQFAVCYFLTFRQSSCSGGLNHGDSSFCSEILLFTNKFTVAVTFFFTHNFNEMFIFVGERHDFIDVTR